jgi:hypothetical protein
MLHLLHLHFHVEFDLHKGIEHSTKKSSFDVFNVHNAFSKPHFNLSSHFVKCFKNDL